MSSHAVTKLPTRQFLPDHTVTKVWPTMHYTLMWMDSNENFGVDRFWLWNKSIRHWAPWVRNQG